MWLLIDGKVCKEITKRSSHRDDRTMHHSLKALKAFASFQSIPKTLLFLKERCQRPLLSTVFFFSLNCVCVYGCVWICFNLSDPLAWRQSPDSWLVLCLLRLLFIRSTENVMMMWSGRTPLSSRVIDRFLWFLMKLKCWTGLRSVTPTVWKHLK